MVLDLRAPMQVGRYNDAVPPEWRLPDFGRPDRLALVLGNSGAFWTHLQAAVRADISLAAAAHPVERFVERLVAREFDGYVRYAPENVALQRAADLAGLAWLGPGHLSVHPVYGPWIALRAVVVLDRPAPPEPPRPARCPGCARGCVPALERAVAAGWDERTTWPLWLAIRDACPLGREHRYPEDAIRYHYTKDRSSLQRHWLQPLGEEDLPALQEVLDAAPGYRSRVPGPHDARSVLAGGIPGKDKLTLGLREGRDLVGVCDVLRGHPTPEVAYVGLLLLREDRQGGGLGRLAWELARERVRQEWPETRRFRLAVAVPNAQVLGYWRRMGFAETGERLPHEGTEVLLMESTVDG